MPNVINNVKDVGSVIAKLAAGMLADDLQFIKTIDKETEFEGNVNGYSKGDTININKPARFTVGTNADITSAIQDVTEEKVAMALDTQSVIGINLTSAEIATDLALKSWSKRILAPAMSAIGQSIENSCLTAAKNAVYQQVGSAGTTVFDTDTMLAAREKMKKSLVPTDDKLYALLDSTAMRSAVNARKGLFQSSEEISKQYKMGYMGMSDGFTFLENNLLATHTNGTDVSGWAVESTVVTPASGMTTLGIDGVTNTATIKKGTVFTIANVFSVHPITKVSTGQLQQFVVTADTTGDGSTQATLSISPTIYSTGTRQNVDALPADEAAITVVGSASTSYMQSLAYHKSAFRFASVPLVTPAGADMTAQETVDGITVRVWRDGAILTDKMILRLDVLWGFAAVRPEWACRLTA